MTEKQRLQVQGQDAQGNVHLKGTRKALEELRRAIDLALAPGSGDAISVSTFDDLHGRRYELHVTVIARDVVDETVGVTAGVTRAEQRPAPAPLPCSNEDADGVRKALDRIVADDPEMIFRIEHPYDVALQDGKVFLLSSCLPLASRENSGRVRFSFDIPSVAGFRDALSRLPWAGKREPTVSSEHHSAHTPKAPPSAARYRWEDGPAPQSEWTSGGAEKPVTSARQAEMPAWMNGLISNAPLIDFAVATPATMNVADNWIYFATTNFTSGGEKIGGTLRFAFRANAASTFLEWLTKHLPAPAGDGRKSD
ncbi:hypothetical protein A9R05_42730 (plasmid) [Burkholderia sp. KK1]|uniref:hypothetical protein n=1 Tax=Burkholderia sp. M701 TaxID=326454 RepID=UPI000979A34A|nr:hypothetical protein [Burkholderia sp. M701]AQH05736.1 hypothetical protein A9R05_42730 [Burkholderia sp. KK1]